MIRVEIRRTTQSLVQIYMNSDTILKIILPILTAIVSAIITYFIARKQKIDDVTIKRGIDMIRDVVDK